MVDSVNPPNTIFEIYATIQLQVNRQPACCGWQDWREYIQSWNLIVYISYVSSADPYFIFITVWGTV